MIRNKVFIFLSTLLAFRILFACVLPITGDEAYFVEWARHPDVCYYDHPGMVAWLMYPFIQLFGESLLAVRFQAVAAGLLFCCLAFYLGRRLYPGTEIPFRGLVLAGIVPFAAILSVLVSTDTPLAVFWAGALVSFYAACDTNKFSMWLLTGLLLGCAFLSKFLAFGFVPAAFLYLCLAPGKRRLLRTPGPWVALAVTIVLFVPVIVWNYHHDWLTFKFNFVKRQAELGLSLNTFFSYTGGQLLFFSPLVIAVPALFLVRNLRTCLKSEKDLFLVLFAGVPLGGFALISMFRPVGGHWTAVALVPVALLCARSIEQKNRIFWTSTAVTGWALSVLIFIGTLSILFIGPLNFERGMKCIGFSGEKAEWYTGVVFGNPEIASFAEILNSRHKGFLATKSYSLSSVLSFHSPNKTHYSVWGSKSFYGRNFDLWDDPALLRGKTMVFAGFRKRIGRTFIKKMLPHFSSVTVYCFNHPVGLYKRGTRNAERGTKKRKEKTQKRLDSLQLLEVLSLSKGTEKNRTGSLETGNGGQGSVISARLTYVCRSAPPEWSAFIVIVGKHFSGEKLSYEKK
ncbi:glycosyltransferase family 39 protein [Planctomycetota bacterium]